MLRQHRQTGVISRFELLSLSMLSYSIKFAATLSGYGKS